jgi:hypothetical protein
MKILLSMICFLAGLSMTGEVASGQEERGELPEGIRQLIRAADLAEQQVKREGGVAISEEAEQKARTAHRTARRAISDYYAAHFDYDRSLAETAALRTEAAEADTKLTALGNETPPNPPRLQKAQDDRDTKLRALAESEIKLEIARKALNTASNPSGVAAGSSGRVGAPPALPVPDRGQRTGSAELVAPSAKPIYGCRFVYWNDEGSFHLMNQTGTAYYRRFGQSHIVSLDYAFDTPNFFFYHASLGDPAIVEWAFAKYPEYPSFDGVPRFAVWCHDRGGWHWEWSYREAVCDWLAPGSTPVPTVPSPPVLLPGPAMDKGPISTQPVVLVAERP